MFNKFISLTALALIFSVNAHAQETDNVAEEPVSSEVLLQRETIAQKNAVLKDINSHVYRTNDSELREFVRNSNAMKKIMDPDAVVENVNVKDKEAVSKFMQKDIGLPEKIVVSQPAKETADRVYKSRASQDLK